MHWPDAITHQKERSLLRIYRRMHWPGALHIKKKEAYCEYIVECTGLVPYTSKRMVVE